MISLIFIINSEVSLFADDAKSIKITRTEQDAINLQSNNDNLRFRSNLNFNYLSYLLLNSNRYKFMQ